MKQQFALILFVLLSNAHQDLISPLYRLTLTASQHDSLCESSSAHLKCRNSRAQQLLPSENSARQQDQILAPNHARSSATARYSILLADAKGVAGLGKAGGDGQGGSDKAGQQVPPEVYKALSYAGSLFLLTLSVPLILYGLNKLLNEIEDCFGCGPSSAKEKLNNKQNPKQFSLDTGTIAASDGGNMRMVQDKQPQKNKNQLHQNQKYHLQLMHQQPKCYNFTPLQEFDVGLSNLNPDSLQTDYKQQQHHLSSSVQPSGDSCAINISSDLESVASANINRSETLKTSPNGRIDIKKSIDYNNPVPHKQSQQLQKQPFIISSPHL